MQFLYQLFNTLTYPIWAFLNSPMEILSAPRRLLGLSLPMRVAVLTFIFLLTCVITAFVSFLFLEDRAHWATWFRQDLTRMAAILLLLAAIPVVVYWAVRLWLHQEISRYPDIAAAWKEGVTALRAANMDISETALFLVTGVRDSHQAETLMKASDVEIIVRQTPKGSAPLHWYGTNKGIFLFTTRCGRVGRLQLSDGVEDRPARGPSPETYVPPEREVGRGTHVPGAEGVGRGTVAGMPMEESFDDRPSPGGGGGGGYTGTMQFGGGGGFSGTMQFGAGGAQPFNPLANTGPKLMTLNDGAAKEESARLQHVCELLREARQPYCPLNGILSYLPFDLIRNGERQCLELQKAAQADMFTLRENLKVRCAIIALVANMESEKGFQELVRRIGKKAAKDQRFGKGFNLWTYPDPEQLEAVAAHACGAFEDWTYYLFKEKDGLTKTKGNNELYSLLCKVRSQIRTYFTNLLAEVYGHDPEKKSGPGKSADPDPFLFLGCYFAGTGDYEDQQAFVKSVFAKLCESEEALDWMPSALEEDMAHRKMANVAFGWATLMLASIIGMLIYYFTHRPSADA